MCLISFKFEYNNIQISFCALNLTWYSFAHISEVFRGDKSLCKNYSINLH